MDNLLVNNKTQQLLKLYALGGSSLYEWFVEDKKFAVVSQEGVVLPKEIGETQVIVRDRRNVKNFDKIDLKVSHISKIEFVEQKKELLVDGRDTALYFSLDQNNQRFTNCTFIGYEFSGRGHSDLKVANNALGYSSLLSKISGLVTESREFRNRVTANGSINYNELYLKHNSYKRYLDDAEITQERLVEILTDYENYGICGGVNLVSSTRGDATVVANLMNDFYGKAASVDEDSNDKAYSRSSTLQTNSNGNEELQIKIFDKYATIGPETDKRYFVAEEFILAYGSELDWTLSGGPSPWEDDKRPQKREFVQQSLNSDRHPIQDKSAHEALIDIHYLQNQTTESRSAFRMTCTFPRDQTQDHLYDFKLTTYNQQDEKLIFPLKLSHSLKIACRVPKSLNLFLIRGEESLLSTKKFRGHRTDSLVIRNQRKHPFQVWAYDATKQPFYNFDSITMRWRLDTAAHGSLIDPKTQDFTQQLQLNDHIGNMTMFAESWSYKKDHPPGKDFPRVFDSVSLNILNNLELVPSYKLVYLHPENSVDIQIKEGSGKFKVTCSDTSIASFEYKELERIVRVKPLKQGSIVINVEDAILKSSIPASSEILIMRAVKVVLDLEKNLLQEGLISGATVTVYDENDNKFNEDQFHKMDLKVIIDTENEKTRSSNLEILPSPGHTNKFRIRGLIIGNYQLVARIVSCYGRETISSNFTD